MACYNVSPYTCTYDSGGNGSLPGGGNPDYSSLATWEAASDNDLAGYSGPVILDCYDSQDHADNITMGGTSNTSATIYREVRSSASCATPWAGKYGTGANFADGLIIAGDHYARLTNLYSEVNANSSANVAAFNVGSATGGKIINCVAKSTNAGSGQGNGYKIAGGGFAYNCIAYNCKTDGFNLESSGTNSAINCVALSNGVYGFRGGFYTHIVYNCYAANNGTADFLDNTSYWDAPSGWNASKDASADLGGKAGDNYKNGLDLITAGKMDSDGLALADDLYANGDAGDRYGRNPYNDLSSVIDFDDFLKNDAAGEVASKKDIRGTDRPTPDTADASWNVGASEAGGGGGGSSAPTVNGVSAPSAVNGVTGATTINGVSGT